MSLGNPLRLIKDDYTRDHVLFSTDTAIHYINLLSGQTEILVGGRSGYKEGIGTDAKFTHIKDFCTGPKSDSLWVVDYRIPCIRNVNRNTNKTSAVIGNCQGNDSSRFARLTTIERNPNQAFEYFVYSSLDIQILRVYRTQTDIWKMEELYHWRDIVVDLIFNPTGDYIYLATFEGIWKQNLQPGKAKELVVSTEEVGNHLFQSKYVSGLFFFDEKYLLAPELRYHTINVLNIKLNVSTKMCFNTAGSDLAGGSLSTCKLRFPSSIIMHPTDRNKILIGGRDLMTLTCKFNSTLYFIKLIVPFAN